MVILPQQEAIINIKKRSFPLQIERILLRNPEEVDQDQRVKIVKNQVLLLVDAVEIKIEIEVVALIQESIIIVIHNMRLRRIGINSENMEVTEITRIEKAIEIRKDLSKILLLK